MERKHVWHRTFSDTFSFPRALFSFFFILMPAVGDDDDIDGVVDPCGSFRF